MNADVWGEMNSSPFLMPIVWTMHGIFPNGIRTAMEGNVVGNHRDHVHVTASLALLPLRTEHRDIDAILHDSAELLKQSKQRGKNRITLSATDPCLIICSFDLFRANPLKSFDEHFNGLVPSQ